MAQNLLTSSAFASLPCTRKFAVESSARFGSFVGPSTRPCSAQHHRRIPAQRRATGPTTAEPRDSTAAVTWASKKAWASATAVARPTLHGRSGFSASGNVAAHALQTRSMHSTAHRSALSVKSHPSKNRDRGPESKEDTQTDFGAMNMLGNMVPPSTAVDACLDDGFALDSGLKVTEAGVLLVGGEAFKWRPWIREGEGNHSVGGRGAGKVKNAKGMFEVDKSVWGVLDLVWPKPDLLILGTGEKIVPVSPQTRRDIAALGIRIEVQDTRNAAAQFNMLATERGTQQVAAALVPIGWRE